MSLQTRCDFTWVRIALLQALGAACVERPVGDSQDSSGESSGASQTGGEATGSGTSGATGSGSGGEALCEPDPMRWQGTICLPRVGDSCGPCDAECLQSGPVSSLANSMLGACCFWEAMAVCGPAAVDDICCYVVEITGCGCEGRPLLLDGACHTAPAVARDDWSDALTLSPVPSAVRPALAARWTAAALTEHASIASFARFILQLLAVGAPADLVVAAQAALADEVEHARRSFAVASALRGEPVGPGPLPAALGPLATSLVEVARDTFVEGCVNEAVSAALAGIAAERCEDPELRALLRTIADDELRHAALAWRTLAWALARREGAALWPVLAAVRPPALPARPAPSDDLTTHGRLSQQEEAAVAAQVWDEVVRPCLSALAPRRLAARDSLPQPVFLI